MADVENGSPEQRTPERPPLREQVIAGKTLLHPERASEMLGGMKPDSISSEISRGKLRLTRYRIGRRTWYDRAEIEKAIIARAVPPGRRTRR